MLLVEFQPSKAAAALRAAGHDPKILTAKPVVKGTLISVELVIGLLAAGWTQRLRSPGSFNTTHGPPSPSKSATSAAGSRSKFTVTPCSHQDLPRRRVPPRSLALAHAAAPPRH